MSVLGTKQALLAQVAVLVGEGQWCGSVFQSRRWQSIDCADYCSHAGHGSTPVWLASGLVSRHKFTAWSGQPEGMVEA